MKNCLGDAPLIAEALQLCEHGLGAGGPRERTTMQTVVGDVGVDPLQQAPHAAERSAPNGLVGGEPEPERTLDLIEPARIGRRAVHVIAGMTGEPGLDSGMQCASRFQLGNPIYKTDLGQVRLI